MEAKIKNLIETYGSNDQRTQAWHLKRGEMLTASEIYKALPDSSEALKRELKVQYNNSHLEESSPKTS